MENRASVAEGIGCSVFVCVSQWVESPKGGNGGDVTVEADGIFLFPKR